MESWRRVWLNEPCFEFETITNGPSISVIIPYRNEGKNLPLLLDSLCKQSYSNWELILVNDHSSDNGVEVCKAYETKFSVPIHLIDNNGFGKKKALKTGAGLAKGEQIVTSDADCIFQENWLAAIASFYTKTNADLIIGGVQMFALDEWWGKFQVSEMAALQITGAAAAISGKPIMMNGANMACKKAFFLEANLKTQIASGDDMFLLEEAKLKTKNIAYLKSQESIVYTTVQESFATMLAQKARWATKAKKYSDRDILKVGLLNLLMNMALPLLFGACFVNSLFGLVLLLFLVIKMIADVRLLKSAYHFFSNTICLREMLLNIVLYPFYMVLVLLYPFFKPLKWKGRRI